MRARTKRRKKAHISGLFTAMRIADVWCRWPESNRHCLRNTPLKRACLPISPHRQRAYYLGTSAGSFGAGAVPEPPGISTGLVSEAEESTGAVTAVGTIDFVPAMLSG